MQSVLLLVVCTAAANAFYFKRTLYGDANEGAQAPDYVNAYYGFPSAPPQEPRRRPSFNLYPPQGYFRREHPFDFGPFGHRSEQSEFRMGEANLGEKTDRERAMEKAKPGFWRQNQRETMDRIKKIIEEKRMDMEQKHVQIRKVLASEGAEIRSKFADLHKRLLMKNIKMASTDSPVPELSRQAKKIEKEAKKIMENGKMSVEKKQEKLDKLMLKAPESVKAELNAINDSGTSSAPALVVSPPAPLPSQLEVLNRSQQTQAVVEARQIRVSEDGKTVEF
ncbi:unnamed protein product [Caenorhabditis sp. 36 PRJEB53466]|nr:unnamed protein product [Caenorhabditis sp. 36 PRJEB53466]